MWFINPARSCQLQGGLFYALILFFQEGEHLYNQTGKSDAEHHNLVSRHREPPSFVRNRRQAAAIRKRPLECRIHKIEVIGKAVCSEKKHYADFGFADIKSSYFANPFGNPSV